MINLEKYLLASFVGKRVSMFAHEIDYSLCSHCGEKWCFEKCLYGVGESHVSSNRDVEVLPTLQTAQGSQLGEFWQGQEPCGQPTPPLQTLPPHVPIIAKARARSYSTGCNLPSSAYFDSYGEMGDF